MELSGKYCTANVKIFKASFLNIGYMLNLRPIGSENPKGLSVQLLGTV